MALGGIAVSGGTTGHGTLISTNLLYAPFLLDTYEVPMARPTCVLGGTDSATGYEAAFATDRDQRTLFKTATSGNDRKLSFDLGAGNANIVYGIVLLGHNLTTDNIDDSADSYAGAWLEGGTTTGYSDISAALTVNASALTPAYHLLASPQAYRYWRVRVNFNSSLALQIGEAFLIGAPPLAFVKNYNKRFPNNKELGMVKSTGGLSGIPRVYTRWERRYMEIRFTNISDSQLEAMQAAARNGHVVFSPTGSSGYAYFGVLELEPPTYVTTDKWDVTAHFTESVK